MDAEDYIARVASILSQAMNALALSASARRGAQIDEPALHQILDSLLPELRWLEEHHRDYTTTGLEWPADAPRRIDDLAHGLEMWDPSAPPPPEVLVATAAVLSFAQGGPATA